MDSIRVQTAIFDIGIEHQRMATLADGVGAVASFVGYVRGDDGVSGLDLEHYPGMTEKALTQIVARARQRWPLLAVTVIHRIGYLALGQPIVWVGVASGHRQAAFDACAYIMDFLKTEAPFWKKEHTPQGSRWVDARQGDQTSRERWGE